MGFEISLRFLAVLEDLVQAPDVGIHYKTQQDGELRLLPANAVSGIFSSILAKFTAQCDFNPHYDVKRALAELQENVRGIATRLAEWAELAQSGGRLEEAHRFAGIADDLARLTPPAAPRPDPSGS